MSNDKNELNFNVDPQRVPVLYSDTYLIGSNDNAVTFSFAQAMPGSNQQTVVSRVALTLAQAKQFAKNLNDHIEKFEL